MTTVLRSTRSHGPVLMLALLFLLVFAGSAAAESVPQSVKVQGYLSDRTGGTPMPANGVYSMTFEIYDVAAGGVPLAIAGPISVTVTKGVYEASIPVTTSAFDGPSRFLQITVNSQVLAPRLSIDSAPFALRSESAGKAETVAPGSVVPESMAPGAVTSVAIADGAVTSSKIGVPCGEGQVLLRSGGTWTCGNPPATPQVCPVGSFISCYTGPPGTQGIGVCKAGVSPCRGDGTGFGACAGEVTPSPEQCDSLDNDCDGTVDEGACPTCGDGVISAGEACDDGNTLTETACPYGTPTCQRCNATCTTVLNLTGPYCGDAMTTNGESCDDGNNVTESSCPYGTPTCIACNASCTAPLNLTGPHCGDGIANGPEVCDDGNNVTETSCPYGNPACTACDASCTVLLHLTGPYCGDGVANGQEACDDGNKVTESSCPYGTPTCTACNAACTVLLHLTGPYCGDGIANGPEACDDGNNVTETSCPYGTPTCTACIASCAAVINLTGPYCGDGILNGPETCDDGNTVSGDGCSATCQRE